jgi:23S rRNA pseudouridine2605 synthase
MAEYKGKKTGPARSDKKNISGRQEKRTGFTKRTNKPEKRLHEDLKDSTRTIKRETRNTDSSSKPFRKKNSLAPKIKKSFSEFEENSKQRKGKFPIGIKETSDFKRNRPVKEKSTTTEKDSRFRDKKYQAVKKDSEYRDQKKFAGKSKTSSSVSKEKKGSETPGPIRLNRYIAASGICSRREADEMIKLGEVKVNGKVVTEMGIKVEPTDRVEVGGQSISPEKKVYILMNKPKDVVSTVSDPHADRTVLDLIKHAGPERVYPVGRLDKSTTGVLLLTNDGELTKKLTHPGYNKKKVYHVVLDKPATKAQLQQIAEGVQLEDGFIHADAISFVKEGDHTEIGIELHSGRNRIVRRIFEHMGLTVVKLDRVYFAGLTKKNLPRGKWRYLSDKEIAVLKRGAYE